jgi:hypothetical protein
MSPVVDSSESIACHFAVGRANRIRAMTKSGELVKQHLKAKRPPMTKRHQEIRRKGVLEVAHSQK